MRESHWIEGTRTRLQPQERQALLAALASDQKAYLLEHDYVWVEGVGVLWNPPDGNLLRRARFTHGTHFQTQRGEFYIDSEGNTRQLFDHPIDPPTPTARPLRLPRNGERSDDLEDGDGLGNPVPRVEAGSLRGMVGAQNAKAT